MVSHGFSDCKQIALIFVAPNGPITEPRPSAQAVGRSITVARDCGLFKHPLGYILTLGQSDHLRRAPLDLHVDVSLCLCMAGARPPITKHPPDVADIGAIVEHIARTLLFRCALRRSVPLLARCKLRHASAIACGRAAATAVRAAATAVVSACLTL